jgi:hypothetical protein
MRSNPALSLDLLRTSPAGAIECFYRKHFLWYLPLVLPLYRVGRDENNEIVLDDPTVSARHALLTPFLQELLVEDLESKNGVRYRGTRIPRAKLSVGESVQVGLFTLRFVAPNPQRAGGEKSAAAESPTVPCLVALPEGKRLPLIKRVTRLAKEGDAVPAFIRDAGRVLLLVPPQTPMTVNDQPIEGVVLLREGDRLLWNGVQLLFTFFRPSS